jgi:folate-dependent tRNA-U54 methylase TrmFO/GidA
VEFEIEEDIGAGIAGASLAWRLADHGRLFRLQSQPMFLLARRYPNHELAVGP